MLSLELYERHSRWGHSSNEEVLMNMFSVSTRWTDSQVRFNNIVDAYFTALRLHKLTWMSWSTISQYWYFALDLYFKFKYRNRVRHFTRRVYSIFRLIWCRSTFVEGCSRAPRRPTANAVVPSIENHTFPALPSASKLGSVARSV